MLDLFEVTGEPRWLQESVRLAATMIADFEDRENGGFFLTVTAEPARLKEGYDGPIPSGNSVAALDLIRLAELTGDTGYRKAADRTVRFFSTDIERNPAGHATMLTALDLLLNGVREVVVSTRTNGEAEALMTEVNRPFLPDKVVMKATSKTYPELSKLSSLLEGRSPTARPRAYVCRNAACLLPAESPKALREQLGTR